jgi:hypothetical protein
LVLVVVGLVVVFCFVVGDVLGVLVEIDVDVVNVVTGGVVAVAPFAVLLACFEPPQPATASTAINAPESCARALTLRA